MRLKIKQQVKSKKDGKLYTIADIYVNFSDIRYDFSDDTIITMSGSRDLFIVIKEINSNVVEQPLFIRKFINEYDVVDTSENS